MGVSLCVSEHTIRYSNIAPSCTNSKHTSNYFLVVLQTWGLVALSTVTIGVLVWPMSSTSSYSSKLSLETPSPSSSSTSSSFGLWQESTFSAYRALVRQGSVVAPSSAFSLRLLLAIWYIFSYVIYGKTSPVFVRCFVIYCFCN